MELTSEQVNKLIEVMNGMGEYSQELMNQIVSSVLIRDGVILTVLVVCITLILYCSRWVVRYIEIEDGYHKEADKIACYAGTALAVVIFLIFSSVSVIGILRCIFNPDWVAVRELLTMIK